MDNGKEFLPVNVNPFKESSRGDFLSFSDELMIRLFLLLEDEFIPSKLNPWIIDPLIWGFYNPLLVGWKLSVWILLIGV